MHQKELLEKVIEIDEAIIGLRKDGIGHVYFKPGMELTIAIQYKLLDCYNEITGGIKTPFIFEAGEYVNVTSEARDNATHLEAIAPLSATVVVVNNLAYKLIADFYYKFNRPKQPYKVVSSFNDGIAWLKTEILKEEIKNRIV